MPERFSQLAQLIRERIESPVGPAHQTWFDAIDQNLLDEMNRAASDELGVVGAVLEFESDFRDKDYRVDGYRIQQAFSQNVAVSESLFIRKFQSGVWIVAEEHVAAKRSLLNSLGEWIAHPPTVQVEALTTRQAAIIKCCDGVTLENAEIAAMLVVDYEIEVSESTVKTEVQKLVSQGKLKREGRVGVTKK